MSNRVVLIPGASTGIGRPAAVAFAKKDAKVVVAGQRDETEEALVKELCLFGLQTEFINPDVCNEDDVRGLVTRWGRALRTPDVDPFFRTRWEQDDSADGCPDGPEELA
jgi:NAD(P)-dependent dehydrogenase (short-subunit alcohol dehydrogenase family)